MNWLYNFNLWNEARPIYCMGPHQRFVMCWIDDGGFDFKGRPITISLRETFAEPNDKEMQWWLKLPCYPVESRSRAD